jgi:hypothetical protein
MVTEGQMLTQRLACLRQVPRSFRGFGESQNCWDAMAMDSFEISSFCALRQTMQIKITLL